MTNPLKTRWQQGKVVLNGWVSIPSGLSAEVMSRLELDSMVLDMQHGMHDYRSVVECLRAMAPSPVVPLVRVPANEAALVGQVLDAGAYGVICPMTNTAEDVRRFIDHCRYPPAGNRSNGPVRIGLYAAAPGAYQRSANNEVLCIPMVETRAALEHLEDMLAVPGVDALYVGPTDLGASLGVGPKMDHEEPQMLRAYERILAAAARHDIPVGMHCASAAYARRMADMGFRMVTLGWDTLHLQLSLRAMLAQLRDAGH